MQRFKIPSGIKPKIRVTNTIFYMSFYVVSRLVARLGDLSHIAEYYESTKKEKKKTRTEIKY